jgi:CRISPR-associated endonuclease Csn1
MTEKEQATIVADLKSSMSDEHLRRRFTKQNFNEEEIEKLIEVPVETGCGNLSANAMRKLIPFMREGESYPSAVMLVYPTNKFGYAFPLLPPRSFLGPCWNPEVEKICSIAGRMTNSAIAKHGNPVGAIVEMTREAGHSEKVRKKIHMENVRRAIARGKIKEEIIAKTEIRYPSRKDVDKVLLAKECRWINIYNGEKMTYESIFSNQEDEHIISRNESMDNSLSNRTLCPKNMNAVKGNKTPFEAFGHDKENFKKMKERVKNLVDPYSEPTRNKKTGKLEYQKSPYLSGKKKKFAKESFSKHELKEFTNRALTNTSHACCEARRYLAMLFAGDISRIKTVSGSVVSILRRNWIDKDFTMKDEINPGPGKNRDDHRHHGIDAAVIACADRKVIKKVESQIRRGVPYGKIKVDLPYEEFEKDVQQIIDPLIVRQVAKTKSNFRLHEETLLRMKQGPSTQGEVAPSKRMSIFSMTDAMVDKIKDPEIKKIVKEFRSEGDLKKKAREQIFPYLVDKKGRKRYIKRVQVYEKRNPVKIGAEGKERYVLTGGNRHAEIFLSDLKPYIKVITNLEAATRVRNKERISDALADLVLFIGSTVEMKMKISSKEFGERRVFVVKKITGGKELPKITFALHNDARPVKPAKINAGKTEDDFRKDYTLSLNDLIKAEPVLYYSAIREEVCV